MKSFVFDLLLFLTLVLSVHFWLAHDPHRSPIEKTEQLSLVAKPDPLDCIAKAFSTSQFCQDHGCVDSARAGLDQCLSLAATPENEICREVPKSNQQNESVAWGIQLCTQLGSHNIGQCSETIVEPIRKHCNRLLN